MLKTQICVTRPQCFNFVISWYDAHVIITIISTIIIITIMIITNGFLIITLYYCNIRVLLRILSPLVYFVMSFLYIFAFRYLQPVASSF